MEILLPYVLESKTVDEIHLWFNPVKEEDAKWIETELPKMSDNIRIVKVENNPYPPTNLKVFNSFYEHAQDENAVYLRLDDDIVWLSPGAIDRVFDFRISNPEYFLVSPIIMNNIVTYKMLGGKLDLTKYEREKLEHECNNYRPPSTKDCYWYTSSRLALQSHNLVLENIDNPSKLFTDDKVLNLMRYSINAICFFGMDIKHLPQFSLEEEPTLSYIMPSLFNMRNCIIGDAICAHYSFGPQKKDIDKTDILDRYGACQKSGFSK